MKFTPTVCGLSKGIAIFAAKTKKSGSTDMRAFLVFIIFSLSFSLTYSQMKKVYTTTPTYSEIIAAYQQLEKQSPYAKLITCDTTDGGKPLHLFVISKSKVFDPDGVSKLQKTVLLINNGIHPGEPDGIDASIEFSKTLL